MIEVTAKEIYKSRIVLNSSHGTLIFDTEKLNLNITLNQNSNYSQIYRTGLLKWRSFVYENLFLYVLTKGYLIVFVTQAASMSHDHPWLVHFPTVYQTSLMILTVLSMLK